MAATSARPFLGYLLMLGSALAVALILGPLLERGVLRFFYRRDEVVLVLVTYALFLILEDATKLIWGVESVLRLGALRPPRQCLVLRSAVMSATISR